jgi:signal recognition particle receptor subunit beta
MALFNYATKEITLKIVYYGPGLSGKTTNLQYLHSTLDSSTKGKLLSLSTEADRTLFFDFLPVEMGKIKDFSIRFQLYTVPGQVRYNATRKIVLKGADAVVFVADSQLEMKEQNIDSYDNMMDNLRSNSINPDEIPILLQYNKRDLQNLLSIEELNADLNDKNYPILESSALRGEGVKEAYELIVRLLLQNISAKHKIEIQTVEDFEQPEKQNIDEKSQAITDSPFESVSSDTKKQPNAPHPVSEPSVKFTDISYEDTEKSLPGDDIEESPLAAPLSDAILEEPVEKEKTKDFTPTETETTRNIFSQEPIPGQVIDTLESKPKEPPPSIPDTDDIIIDELRAVNAILLKIHDSFSVLSKHMVMIRRELMGLKEFQKKKENRELKQAGTKRDKCTVKNYRNRP